MNSSSSARTSHDQWRENGVVGLYIRSLPSGYVAGLRVDLQVWEDSVIRAFTINLNDAERQLLADIFHVTSTFAARIMENAPVEREDAEIIARVLKQPDEVKALLVRFNLDRL